MTDQLVRSRPAPAALKPGPRIGLVVGGLIAALIAGFALGKVIDPAAGPGSRENGGAAGVPSTNEASPHAHPNTSSAGSEVGGLSISASGYTLVPKRTAYPAGQSTLGFTITGPDRKIVTTFAIVHDKPLHLVLTRRDLTGYQHIHPTMAPDGTWTAPIDLPSTGMWRAVADFTVIGIGGVQTAVTLGTDLTVAGDYRPARLPAPDTQSAVDGFIVTYYGTPRLGATSPLLFRVTRNGAPVSTLERYLGTYGHLVMLRELDVAYIHTHPEDQLTDGAVKFWTVAPSSGTYRLFFDFQVDGVVHTATFTLTVTG